VIAVTDTTLDSEAIAAPSGVGARARLRQERQARVGILRNPNHPPAPPPRRALLMGKWPNLRSSRRPTPAEVAPPDPAPPPPPRGVEEALHRTADGTVARIDVTTLMASVDGLGTAKPARAAFASEYRHDLDRPDRAPVPPARPSVLSAEAWRDEDGDEPLPLAGPPPGAGQPPRPGRGVALLASACLVTLLLLAALGFGP
jgi:hypothetical protein